MKKLLPIFVFAVAAPFASAQIPFTYETDSVLTASGDFGTADGRRDVVVVHRATGQVTFGRPDASGNVQWSPVEVSGITGVTGLAADKFSGGSVDFASITAPAANRVTIVSPNAANTQLDIRHIYPNNPSPRTLTSFDPDANGTAELFIAGDSNNGTSGRYYYEFRNGLSGTSSLQWATNYSVETHRVFRYVRKTAATPVLGEIYGSQFYTEVPTVSGVTTALLLGGVAVNPATLMTYGNFDGTALAQVILYTPGATTAQAAKATEPTANNFAWAAAATVTFPKAVKQLVTISTTGSPRLGILFADQTAAVYDFNGTTLTFRSNLFGAPFEWLNPIGNDNLLAKTNTGWGRYNTGTATASLTPANSGSFPALGTKPRVSNVIFFSAEPFANPAALPLAWGTVRDWTT